MQRGLSQRNTLPVALSEGFAHLGAYIQVIVTNYPDTLTHCEYCGNRCKYTTVLVDGRTYCGWHVPLMHDADVSLSIQYLLSKLPEE